MERLLTAAGLPIASVGRQLPEFEVAEDGGRIVGTAGLEPYGRVALLRSLAVEPEYRGRGVAHELVERTLQHAAAAGIRSVYLLTTTAADYFRKFGFEAITREEVSPDVLVSEEFGEGCCDTAQAMRLTLNSVRTELRSRTQTG
ncbi:MAG TPA: arsenic resistance N-acetyltransferase ArsN2 [bacterium]|nr:arsenic resistance N-acetyltransferase ArsN2 [bacterium]